MSERRVYSAAPITEAVLELRFADAVDLAEIEKASKKVAARYPSETRHQSKTAKIDLAAEAAEFTDLGISVRRSSVDESDIIVIGPKNFLVSRVAPYQNWEHFFGRISADWKDAKKVFGHRTIERVGLRYINRLDLPQVDNNVTFEDYLNVFVRLPDMYPVIGPYNLQLEMAVKNPDCMVTINSGVVDPVVPGRVSFLLDIDVAKTDKAPQKTDDLFELLQAMAVKKNEIFESLITDKTRALIDVR